MYDADFHSKRYVLAAVLGAMVGGLTVAFATRAIPRMMSQMMSTMMQNMMAQMAQGGCDPAEMRRQMTASFGEAQKEQIAGE